MLTEPERLVVREPVYDMDHLATFTVDAYSRGEDVCVCVCVCLCVCVCVCACVGACARKVGVRVGC